MILLKTNTFLGADAITVSNKEDTHLHAVKALVLVKPAIKAVTVKTLWTLNACIYLLIPRFRCQQSHARRKTRSASLIRKESTN